MPWVVRNIQLNKAEWFSTVDRGASADESGEHRPRIVLWKRDKPSLAARVKSLLSISKQESKPMTLEEILAKLSEDEQAVILGALEAAKAAVAPAPAPAPMVKAEEETPMPIEKRDDVPEEIKAELKKRDEQRVELEKRLAKMEDDAMTIAIQERVSQDMATVPGDRGEFIELLKRARKSMDAKDADAIEDRFVSMAKAIREDPRSILRPAGNGAADVGGDAMVIVEKRAKEIQAANAGTDLASAKMQVYRQDPELYRRVRAEAAE